MPNSNPSAKPQKPYPDFPLYAHASGRWAKKIKGKLYYFGKWDDADAALAKYNRERDYLYAGQKPPVETEELAFYSIGQLIEECLDEKLQDVQDGVLSARTYRDYRDAANVVTEVFGNEASVEALEPGDFTALRRALSKRHKSPSNLAAWIGRVDVLFNWAFSNQKIARPVNKGGQFKKPSKKAMRMGKNAAPKKLFYLPELKALYAAADDNMKAFLLLALNGGLGNHDIATLKPEHITGDTLDFPRPKTAVPRTVPLWPETMAAIERAKNTRSPLPWLFVTRQGNAWFKEQDYVDNTISKKFRELCKDCGCHKRGRGFYALRHTFRTIADSMPDKDSVAIDHIMGHEGTGTGELHYVESVLDLASFEQGDDMPTARLQKVTDHVYSFIKSIFEN